MSTKERMPNVTIEDARIIFRNLGGREGEYNREGDRNFCVLIDDETAEKMGQDGWNVKFLKPREEGDTPQAYIPVSVSYKNRPPRVVLITSRGRTTLPEDLVEMIDYVDIQKVDMVLNPYQWVVRDNSGVKAYLKSMFVTVMEDELDRKYADVPEIDLQGKPLEIASSAHEDDVIEGEIIED